MQDIVTQAPKNLDYNNRFFKDNKKDLEKYDYIHQKVPEQPKPSTSKKLERGTLQSSKQVKTTKTFEAGQVEKNNKQVKKNVVEVDDHDKD